MVDLGDLREGMMPAELPAFLDARRSAARTSTSSASARASPATARSCPTSENLGELVELAEAAERQLGRQLLVSGGMSTSIDAAASGEAAAADRQPAHRRGDRARRRAPSTRERILGLHTDAITRGRAGDRVQGQAVDADRRSARRTRSAAVPVFEDRGERRRAICAIGRQDVPAEGLAAGRPARAGARRVERPPRARRGRPARAAAPSARRSRFVPDYSATLAAVHLAVRGEGVRGRGVNAPCRATSRRRAASPRAPGTRRAPSRRGGSTGA